MNLSNLNITLYGVEFVVCEWILLSSVRRSLDTINVAVLVQWRIWIIFYTILPFSNDSLYVGSFVHKIAAWCFSYSIIMYEHFIK